MIRRKSNLFSSGSNCSAISTKPSATPRNIRVQAPRRGSLLDRRADGVNQVPPRSIHKAAPARLMHQAPSHSYRQHVDAIDAINDDIATKVSKEDDEVDEQDWQTDTMSTRTSSARDWNLESSAMPRNIRLQIPRNHSLLDRRVDRINQVPFMCRGSSSDNYHHRLSALDASDERRLHKGHAVTTKCLQQPSSTASKSSKTAPEILGKVKDKVATVRSASAHTSGGTVGARKKEAYITTLGAGGGYGDPHPPPFYKCEYCIETSKCLEQSSSAVWESSNSSGVHLEKEEATSAEKDEATSTDTDWTSGGPGSIWNWEDEYYINTLGPGGGYGYPHPPPFYKCEVCRKRTAFYRIKCCLLVVCEHCSCECDPVEDEALQEQDRKEELPEVKLEGSDLFLWQQCSFPAELMLCLARRTGDHLRYYFAHISDLMDPEVQIISATVYNFRLQGRNASSLTVSYEFLTRSELAHG